MTKEINSSCSNSSNNSNNGSENFSDGSSNSDDMDFLLESEDSMESKQIGSPEILSSLVDQEEEPEIVTFTFKVPVNKAIMKRQKHEQSVCRLVAELRDMAQKIKLEQMQKRTSNQANLRNIQVNQVMRYLLFR